MKDVRRALRKLGGALRAIRRMQRQLALALARGEQAQDDLVDRIVSAKAEAARLREGLDQRQAAVALQGCGDEMRTGGARRESA